SSRTLDMFLERYSDHALVPAGRRDRAAFKRQNGREQLELFFQVQARDLYDRVDISPTPAPLDRFRRSVNPDYVARYFAPTFGQGAVPGLTLFNRRPRLEAEALTNFYLLTRFSNGGDPMINRADPEQSLLLQWGLPREDARFPAPDVDGWRPAFRSSDDAEFRRYAEWIASLYPEELDYGIRYPGLDGGSE
ncbi:MAG: hypothetical protein AAFX76_04580, partial [Planctomycetota bacterium]